MDDLYRTPRQNGRRELDSDEVTTFLTPNKVLTDSHKYRWRDPTSPGRTFPDSNRDNVVDALKNIQDRIRCLEMERSSAEENLRGLSDETSRYRRNLEKAREDSPLSASHMSRQQEDLHNQLKTADARCELLDKQLEYMRKMLNEAEAEKRLAYDRSEQLARLRSTNTESEMKAQMEKIAEMEREHFRLQANQAHAQEKIKELEKQLETQKREQIATRNRSAELRSTAEANRILIDKLSPPSSPNKVPPPRQRRKKSKRITPEPGIHYRLNMADIPFVVGQATTPSHRLGTNVQNIIAMMKNHNPRLCAAAGKQRRVKPRYRARPATAADNEQVANTLSMLVDEYTHMTTEHHELTRKLDSVTSSQLASDLQRELAKLTARMETKAEQIANLRHQQTRPTVNKDPQSSRSLEARKAYHVPSCSTTGEVEVTTTIKTKGRKAGVITEERPPSRQENARTLQNLKTIRAKLTPDELQWT